MSVFWLACLLCLRFFPCFQEVSLLLLANTDYSNIVNSIVAVGILLVSYSTYRNNRRSKANTEKLDNNTAKLEDLKITADEIHVMTNQTLTDAQDKANIAEDRADKLEEEAKD